VKNDLQHVTDGECLLSFLRKTILLNEQLPHVILLDINMPRLDGLEALKIIKGHRRLSHIPVIVYTTSLCEKQLKKSVAAGANAYVCKQNHFQDIVAFARQVQNFLNKSSEIPGKI
jgi:two-component system, response regulator